ncbi:biotin-dependent carboxyltransferase family protein [Paenibacillus beijingensis]|uniref:KipI antagonist n=1 Tax=Paenibacillus beijingensis TaxID=1126833 RepID=A0A0D5NGR3_9BACL|nr:biotin-dependent carboxyltransferase family protein [Paenibacillus beijingensis]AJY74127.1 KipI antagonist [Paenibacillus beijingensis]
MSFRIGNPGLLTTVQDLGRFGYQRQGVIVSGAMDRFALRMANLLVGNAEGEAALEATLIGPEITFGQDALISVCGGDLSAEVGGRPLPMWRPVWIRAGQTLRFGGCRSGARAYVAVAGGIGVPIVMESRSTYLRAGLGGCEGRALKEGDELSVGIPSALSAQYMERLKRVAGTSPFAAPSWFAGGSTLPGYSEHPAIRFVPGRDYSSFAEESRQWFEGRSYRVTPQSDRMGYRLEGPPLSLKERLEPISSAVATGTVQVPEGGQPIMLMADRQTIGGYPVVAQVVTADLPLLAQLRPGQRVRFAPVTIEQAEELYILGELELRQAAAAIAHYMKESR